MVASKLMTPIHFKRSPLERGAAFGLEPVLTQSAYFRPHNQSEEVAGLYLVGAGTHPARGRPRSRRRASSTHSSRASMQPEASSSMKPERSTHDDARSRDLPRAPRGWLEELRAARLLPTRVRDAATVIYAFCRIADDAVDSDPTSLDTVRALRERLVRVYEGRPDAHAVDRALSRVVRKERVPMPLLEALLEGFVWDLEARRYETLDEVHAYAARVAGTVGAIMTVLMGPREANVVARACDLGVAMQLTNIARDVGEDAARGRLYLPAAAPRRGRRSRRSSPAPKLRPPSAA
ncbi:MAG: squalene/phytoene synthase family protein [Polyangiaceae bacterium]